jgi:hypothetical protein
MALKQTSRTERILWKFWRQEFEKRGQDREDVPEITYLSPDELQEKFVGVLK